MESVVDSAPQFVTDVVMDYQDFGDDDFPDEAGNPFEDPLMRHTDIRSHLEDLAQRHPEFADQLRYPAWSNENTSNTWGRKRRGSGHSDAGEASKQQPTDSARPETNDEPLRGRPKENLRNTVPDMGQKQQEAEDKESRGQRSWSAPPDNRTQPSEKPRFVSKIEINPVNPDAPQTQSQPTGDATKPPMAPPKPQPQQQQTQPQPQTRQSNVRHIPIFVEGRDEPVLPKNIEPEFTQSQAPPKFSRPPPQPQYSSPPHHYQPQAPHRKQSTPTHYEQQPQPPPQHKPEPPPPQPEPEQPAPPAVNPRDPLYRVECVQKEVDELKGKVENFNGSSRSDKEYILLDEMLTRNLIKLDDIETEGKDEVRAARKNTIKSIQRCISVLEHKVPVPGSEKSDGMLVDEQSGDTPAEGSNDAAEAPGGDKPMDVDQQASQEGSSEVPPSEEKKEGSAESAVPSGEAENNAA